MVKSKPLLKIIYADRLLDCASGAAKEGMALLADGGVIKDILLREHLDLPEGDGYRVLDFPGSILLPGLIDCHTHTG